MAFYFSAKSTTKVLVSVGVIIFNRFSSLYGGQLLTRLLIFARGSRRGTSTFANWLDIAAHYSNTNAVEYSAGDRN
jgi:hypothetical protein